MANEITVSVSLTAAKGNIKYQRAVSNVQSDMTGSNYSAGSWSVPTTAAGTAIPVNASVGTPGFTFFRNADSAHFIELGVQVGGTFYPFAKLLPGEVSVVRLGTSAPYARADTAAADLEFGIAEA